VVTIIIISSIVIIIVYNRAYPHPDPYAEVPLTIRITLDYSFNGTITHHRLDCVLQRLLELENIETFSLTHIQDAIFVGEPIFTLIHEGPVIFS
jgi:hypothetical protein